MQEISTLASSINEEKRESESRRRLVQYVPSAFSLTTGGNLVSAAVGRHLLFNLTVGSSLMVR